jgi:hypothetical protein
MTQNNSKMSKCRAIFEKMYGKKDSTPSLIQKEFMKKVGIKTFHARTYYYTIRNDHLADLEIAKKKRVSKPKVQKVVKETVTETAAVVE